MYRELDKFYLSRHGVLEVAITIMRTQLPQYMKAVLLTGHGSAKMEHNVFGCVRVFSF